MSLSVYIVCFEFGIDDFLTLVKSKVSREHVAEGDG